MDNLHFQLGAEIQLFKTDLVGMVDSASNCLIIRQPNAGFDAPGMSIDEFLSEVKGIFDKILGEGSLPDIQLPDAIQTVTKGINLYLKEIFMILQFAKPGETETAPESKSVEFAIWVSMDTSDELRAMFPVAIKQGYLKVWNTTRKVILDEMQIASIQSLFGQASTQEGLPNKPADEPAS